jgi:hypothetical protein
MCTLTNAMVVGEKETKEPVVWRISIDSNKVLLWSIRDHMTCSSSVISDLAIMGFPEYDLPQLSVGEELVDLTDVLVGKRSFCVLRLLQQRPITITLLVQADA